MLPVIYYIKYDKTTDMYYKIPATDRFIIPDKVYGKAMEYATRVWNKYVLDSKTTGVLLTGDSGVGKTLIAELIANIALDNKISVVVIADIEVTTNLIAYISTLSNCVIMFDEFSKNTKYDVQETSLTMFSDINNTNKLFILTENDVNTVSRFIRDRPGRIHYHMDFSKLDVDVLNEYCVDMKVNNTFLNELLTIYNKTLIFSFDHLKALVNEHKRYPNDNIEDLIKVLNLGFLKKAKQYHVISIKDNTDKDIEFTEYSFPVEHFNTGSRYWIRMANSDSLMVTSDMVVSDREDIVMLETKGMKIMLKRE